VHPLTAGLPRVVRGLVSWACVLVSMSGHVLAGEPPAATSTLVLAVAVLAVLCVAASRWRWTFWRLLAVTAASEPGFHVVFELGGPADGHHAAAGRAGMPPREAGTGFSGWTGAAVHAVQELVGDPTMLAGHAGAAVILAVLLARGEAWAWALVDLVTCSSTRCLALLLAARVLPPAPGLPRPGTPAPRAPRAVLLLGADPRRGPPASSRRAHRLPSVA
jgi:hypothetical protein